MAEDIQMISIGDAVERLRGFFKGAMLFSCEQDGVVQVIFRYHGEWMVGEAPMFAQALMNAKPGKLDAAEEVAMEELFLHVLSEGGEDGDSDVAG